MNFNKANKNLIKSMVIRLATLFFVVAGIIILIPSGRKAAADPQSLEGAQYIATEEARDAASIEEEIRKNTAVEELEGMGAFEVLNHLNTYLVGDSRIVGFHYTDFDSNHIIAEASTTIKWIDEKLPELVAAKPANLILSFGMNDLGMYQFDPENYWGTGEEYAEAYLGYVNKIHEALPDTNVFINLILPATEAGTSRQPMWLRIDEYNEALKKMCDENDITYIDMSDFCYAHPEYYESDGVHIWGDIYDVWGEAMAEAVKSRL